MKQNEGKTPKYKIKETDMVTVCDSCLQACCWQGNFMCEDSREAGTRDISVKELRKLDRENEKYWIIDLEAKGLFSPLPDQAGEGWEEKAKEDIEKFLVLNAKAIVNYSKKKNNTALEASSKVLINMIIAPLIARERAKAVEEERERLANLDL